MKRIITAVILIPISLLIVKYAPPEVYLIGIGALGALCLHEYHGLVKAMGVRPMRVFGFVCFWGLLIALRWLPAIPVVATALIATFLAAMWQYRLPIRERALSLMAEVLGIFYFAVFLYTAIPTRYDFPHGLYWTIVLLAVVWAGDTFALAVGKTCGRTRFAAKLSPGKTNEGALGGLAGGILVAVLLQHFLFNELPLVHVIAVSILAGVFGQLGDLAESMLKRAAEVKDSSHLIPGHGGALDRLDSLLFAFPVLYVYLSFLYRTHV